MTIAKFIKVHDGIKEPYAATEHSAGYDLHANLTEPVTLQPMERKLVGSGIKLDMQPDLVAQIVPRSGLAIKDGITVLNTPGTIDSDYKDEVKVILINLGTEPVTIQPNERIAQMVFYHVVRAIPTNISDAKREGGFGSTGV